MTIPINPKIPIFIKKFIFTPLTNNNTMMVITITTPVPKSGSNIIRPKKRKIIRRIGRVPFLKNLMVFVLFDKYFAVKIIKDIFASSLG